MRVRTDMVVISSTTIVFSYNHTNQPARQRIQPPNPTSQPTYQPTCQPSNPTSLPTYLPAYQPSDLPTEGACKIDPKRPSYQPTNQPSNPPTNQPTQPTQPTHPPTQEQTNPPGRVSSKTLGWPEASSDGLSQSHGPGSSTGRPSAWSSGHRALRLGPRPAPGARRSALGARPVCLLQWLRSRPVPLGC